MGKEVTFPPAPDLKLPFIPPVPGQPEKQTTGGKGSVGFELSQEVPYGIDEPPLEKSWKKAFVTTFTYKIR